MSWLALPCVLALASCAVGAGGTIGLHYASDHGVRIQLEVPLELDLVDKRKPYVRAALVPQVFYDTKSSQLDGGVRGALGPVFEHRGYWLSPAVTVGGTGFRGRGSLDVGVTVELEKPYASDASCEQLRVTGAIVPQLSVARRVYDVDHPMASAGGDWDIGIAAGVRRTRFVVCGGGGDPAAARPAR
jgi:hypothetical protein